MQLAPRITLTAVAPRAPFPVLLRLPDGTEKQATAVLDVAHIRGPHGTFALVRLMNMKPADVPVGTEIWRESG